VFLLVKKGAPGRNRTYDTRFRKAVAIGDDLTSPPANTRRRIGSHIKISPRIVRSARRRRRLPSARSGYPVRTFMLSTRSTGVLVRSVSVSLPSRCPSDVCQERLA
jgi:hypothetical protein